jgi:hypothetical protein
VTEKRIFLMVLVIWTLSLTISVVPFMGWSKPEQRNPFKCDLQTDISYVLFSCSVSYYVPLVIILSMYWRIYRAVSRHVQAIQSGVKRGSVTNDDGTVTTLRIHTRKFEKDDGPAGGDSHNDTKLGKTFAKQRKATITLTTIIFGFICMWQGFFLILPLSKFFSFSLNYDHGLAFKTFWSGTYYQYYTSWFSGKNQADWLIIRSFG